MPERPTHTQYPPSADTGEGADANETDAPPGDTPPDRDHRDNQDDHKGDKSARLAALRTEAEDALLAGFDAEARAGAVPTEAPPAALLDHLESLLPPAAPPIVPLALPRATAGRGPRRRVGLGAAFALAAALVIVVVLGRGLSPWPSAPLGPFQAEFATEDAYLGAPGPAPAETAAEPTTRLHGDSTLRLTLRPAERVDDAVEPAAYLQRDGRWARWPVMIEAVHGGAFLLRARVRDLGLPPGRYRLALVVGRRGRLPGGAALDALLAEGRARTTHDFALLLRGIEVLDDSEARGAPEEKR